MQRLLAFGFCLVSMLYPTTSFAQTVTTGGVSSPQTVYNSGGIIQGGIGFSGYGSSQCGTGISTGLSSTTGTSPTLITDKLIQGGTNSFVAQITVSHQLGNPCLSQKEQLEVQAKISCWQTQTQFVLNNPTMPIEEKQRNLDLLSKICLRK
jgi:hypothetical protein